MSIAAFWMLANRNIMVMVWNSELWNPKTWRFSQANASDANTDEPTRMLVVLSPGQLKPSAGGKHVEAIWKFMVSQCSWFSPLIFCRYSQVDPIFKHPRPHLLVLTARLLRARCSSKMEPNARHLTGSYLQRDGSQQKIRCEHGWFGGPRLGNPPFYVGAFQKVGKIP